MDLLQPPLPRGTAEGFERQLELAGLDVPPALRDVACERLRAAMRHALLTGGRRMRPALCFAGCQMGLAWGRRDAVAVAPPVQRDHDERLRVASSVAVALEMVHAASLVLDDLPCMDDAATRRGQPCVHVRHGEGVALLASAALVTRAALLAAALPGSAELLGELLGAAEAMAHGQAADLTWAPRAGAGEGTADDVVRVVRVHGAKTGALFGAAVVAGAMAGLAAAAGEASAVAAPPGADGGVAVGGGGGGAGGAAEHQRQVLAAARRYGVALGIAFQIADDLADAAPSAELETGKTGGRDAAMGRPSYPAVAGRAAAGARALALCTEARDLARGLPGSESMMRIAEAVAGAVAGAVAVSPVPVPPPPPHTTPSTPPTSTLGYTSVACV